MKRSDPHRNRSSETDRKDSKSEIFRRLLYKFIFQFERKKKILSVNKKGYNPNCLPLKYKENWEKVPELQICLFQYFLFRKILLTFFEL